MGWKAKGIVKTLVTLCLWSSASLAQDDASPNGDLRAPLEDVKPTWRAPLSGDWSFAIGQRGMTEGPDEGFASFVILRSRFEYRFLKNLKAYISPRLDLYSSRVQQRFEDDLYDSRMRFIDAYVDYAPTENLNLRLGAFSQDHLVQPLIISWRRTFPGLQQIYRRTLGGLRYSIHAQQLVPTSSSMNTERSEKERLPGFFTESLKIETADPNSNSFMLQLGHYRWQNIPSKVAFESKILGNTVDGDTPNNAKFRSAFEGYFGTLEACYCVNPRFKLSANYQRVRNTLAPDWAADGQGFTVRPVFIFEDYDLVLDYWREFVEPDVTISNYTSSSTVGTNRVGQEARVKFDLKKLGFAIETRWAEAQPINKNQVQKTFTEYYLGLESHYVAF